MGLQEYRKKRHFERTPEPRGKRAASKRALQFVIHKHAASHLHYDLRLELDGVLKSWAVPKGPSLDPAQKRLAVEVEDHPIEYGTFEGVIPKGEYGAGQVIVWDRGTWLPREDPHEGLKRGRLAFDLAGTKLAGGWRLLRMGGRAARASKPQWLLVKERDPAARDGEDAEIAALRPESVDSGRTIEDVKQARAASREWRRDADRAIEPGDARHSAHGGGANGAARPGVARGAARRGRARSPQTAVRFDGAKLPGAKRQALPRTASPQLATLVSAAPEGDSWLHEIKFDGYRLLCRIENGRVRLLTRRGQDWTTSYPPVAEACAALPVRSALLDGEVVMLRADGTTDFQALQNAGRGASDLALTFFAFDLLHLDGWDLTAVPLESRKQALAALLANGAGGVLRFSDHVVGKGASFHEAACGRGLEGIISKRRDAPYTPRRTGDWLKVKCAARQEFVIGGFTEPAGARQGFGALLLGIHDDGGLRYCGRVGTGFTAQTLRDLTTRLERLEVATSPFANPPRGRGVHWVRPRLVGEVAFTGWTSDGMLRHPSFQGLRTDKPASEVVAERPRGRAAAPPRRSASRAPRRATPVTERSASREKQSSQGAARRVKPPAAGRSVPSARVRTPSRKSAAAIPGRLTHPDKVLFQDAGITKLDLARYVALVAPLMLREIQDRPLMLKRCPEGIEKQCFFQKHPTGREPEALARVDVRESKGPSSYLVARDTQGLLALVQIGAIEIHVWGARTERIEQPDRLVFDLDPDPRTPWSDVIEGARAVRRRLEELGLESFVKTTGGKGVHVVAPLRPGPDWDQVRTFSAAVASSLVRDRPELWTTQFTKAKRGGRMLLDTLRNGRGATWVAPYSPRARAGAPVSLPIAWRELTPRLDPQAFTVPALLRDPRRARRDPWREMASVRQTLTRESFARLHALATAGDARRPARRRV